MPLYEYLCESCGRRTEALQRVEDPPLSACPDCGGPLRKLLSAPALQFKGSGWYVTDYASKTGSKTGSEAASDSAGTREAESKTAASSGSAEAAAGTKGTNGAPKPGPGAPAKSPSGDGG